jgi:protein arginine kinase
MLLRSTATASRRALPSSAAEGIAVSCRVRLARNLRGLKFPDWAEEAERRRVFEHVAPWLAQDAGIDQARIVPVGELDEATRALLRERHLISHDLAERGPGSGLVVSGDERVAVMINEEDHLRVQVIEPGMDLHRAWTVADALDARMEQQFDYAFTHKLGFLTACPSNVGTGLRASVMVHLLGLRLTDDLDAVLRALERLHLTVRGVGGEGSDAAGHMFQISNQETLGETETALIDELLETVGDVVHQERNARLRLQRDTPEVLLDCVARALAIIQSARVMETEEALDYLSALRLGVEMELVRRLTVAEVDALTLGIQPGHLQRSMGKTLEPPRRDIVRATVMREVLANVTLRG